MKNRIAKAIPMALALILMLTMAAGCPPPVQEPERVTITLMMWGGAVEEAEVRGYLDAFNEIYPHIEVEIIRPADYWPKLMAMMAAGTPPDVFYMGFPEFVRYHAEGTLLNLQPFVDADPEAEVIGYPFDVADFPVEILDAFRCRETGDLYGIPKDWSTYVVYYNVEMFREAGLPSPYEMFAAGRWTWADFLETAKALTTDDVHGFAYDAGRVFRLFPWQASADWARGPREVVVDTPEFAEGIQFAADLWLVHGVAPDVAEQADMSPTYRFKHEKAAMFILGRWMAMPFKDLPFEWNIAPVPFHRKKSTWVDLVAYTIAADSKHPEEAWKLVNFLTGVPGQRLKAAAGHAIPARMSVAHSPYFLDVLPERGIRNAVHVLPFYRRVIVWDHWGEVWTALERGLEPVWTGEKTAAEVLPEIQAEIDRILADY
ncbi:sugar ABC transporter substrate-binding protein [Dehalococcoidia bacterium]|nr:sugar ABC transporter substrate-binding protein [Dehalococcoidia bacterium]